LGAGTKNLQGWKVTFTAKSNSNNFFDGNHASKWIHIALLGNTRLTAQKPNIFALTILWFTCILIGGNIGDIVRNSGA